MVYCVLIENLLLAGCIRQAKLSNRVAARESAARSAVLIPAGPAPDNDEVDPI